MSRISILALGLFAAALVPQTVWAQSSADEFKLQLTPFVGYRFGGTLNEVDGDGEYKLDDAPAVGFIVNWPSVHPTEWELYFSHQSADITSQGGATPVSGKLDLTYMHIGGTYLFEESGPALPYLVATVGLTHADATDFGSDNYFSFAAGGGWKYFPAKRIGLRLDGRFIGTLVSSNSAIFCQGDGGAACAVKVSGKVLWQFELQAGVVFRF
jgi:hypothetical protein